jgi:hypothetical protein
MVAGMMALRRAAHFRSGVVRHVKPGERSKRGPPEEDRPALKSAERIGQQD